MTVKVGIPSTLYYYSHFPFWRVFFEGLNMEVITSPVTTKEIVDQGVKEAVTDACVPIKIFHGHVMNLRDKVDFLFIPRMVSINGEATFCPKFLGLPDMIRFSLADLPPVIEPRIDLKNSKIKLWQICQSIASNFSIGKIKAFWAYLKALQAQKQFERKLHAKVKPLEYLRNCNITTFSTSSGSQSVRLAVLGYPYELYDPFISVNVLKKLEQLGVEILTIEMIPSKLMTREASRLPKNLFWYYSNQVIRAAYYYLRQGIDGLIHITAFGCGPDAMVDKIMELEAKEHNQIPFMTLTLDEHSGETGVMTRLEAFVDMIRLRKGQNA
jgi:predicted nucleotide-binding protein (sugar kinase/HSP70/actin superfamily)